MLPKWRKSAREGGMGVDGIGWNSSTPLSHTLAYRKFIDGGYFLIFQFNPCTLTETCPGLFSLFTSVFAYPQKIIVLPAPKRAMVLAHFTPPQGKI